MIFRSHNKSHTSRHTSMRRPAIRILYFSIKSTLCGCVKESGGEEGSLRREPTPLLANVTNCARYCVTNLLGDDCRCGMTEMRVTPCRLRVFMTQDVADLIKRHAMLQSDGRERMPKVMQTQSRQLGVRARALPDTLDIIAPLRWILGARKDSATDAAASLPPPPCQ